MCYFLTYSSCIKLTQKFEWSPFGTCETCETC